MLQTLAMSNMEFKDANNYVTNCIIFPRDAEHPLFNGDTYLVRLDSYAILPLEKFHDLMRRAGALKPAFDREPYEINSGGGHVVDPSGVGDTI